MTKNPPELRPIPFAPHYLVSRDGHVYSTLPWRGTSFREITPCRMIGDNYLFVRLRVNGKKLAQRVHTLVALVFHGPKPSPDHQVRHLDGSRDNNHAENLAWGTAQENADDREYHGRTSRGAEHLRKVLKTNPLALEQAIQAGRMYGGRPRKTQK